jgi:hypothetical protein
MDSVLCQNVPASSELPEHRMVVQALMAASKFLWRAREKRNEPSNLKHFRV